MSLFTHASIDFEQLSQKAFNYRWATHPSDVIPLTAADPDFKVSQVIRDAISQYAHEGYFSYGPPEGLPSFKESVARFWTEFKNYPIPAEFVFPTNSAANALFLCASQLLNQGDEAIILDPVDFLFQKSIDHAGAVASRVSIDPITFQYSIDDLNAAVNNKTKVLYICNPHNPIGKVFSKEELLQFSYFAEKHGLKIISDEIWSEIVYKPYEHIPIASVSEYAAKNTYTIHGLSKSFGLAGLRIGYIICPDQKAYQAIVERSGVNTTAFGISTLSQIAGIAAYDKARDHVLQFRDHLQSMRDLAHRQLNQIPQLNCTTPQGCYVIFPKMIDPKLTSEETVIRILDQQKLAIVPGSPAFFGPGAEAHLRLCFATSREILEEGISRLAIGLETIFNN